MASDDMNVIVYKFLRYLYSCMKSGEEPSEEVMANSGGMFEIPYRYWAQIVDEMVANGLVRGVAVVDVWGGGKTVRFDEPRVTMEGLQYLEENSLMRKAAELLRDAKSAIPFI